MICGWATRILQYQRILTCMKYDASILFHKTWNGKSIIWDTTRTVVLQDVFKKILQFLLEMSITLERRSKPLSVFKNWKSRQSTCQFYMCAAWFFKTPWSRPLEDEITHNQHVFLHEWPRGSHFWEKKEFPKAGLCRVWQGEIWPRFFFPSFFWCFAFQVQFLNILMSSFPTNLFIGCEM